ncbi:MAG TPA: RHS repeat-associated core domain-containing protein [Bacteroidales bacterium]|nr:RHS repeat-associated core domain-containing protein [Bacteroidales bacterium]HRC79668.1 RHS repeat-associated core domain-containing protein [Bacteroidales bacterium]
MKTYYHSDHLGSASFVTNAEGGVMQHLQYLPYGELFVSQRNTEFDSRYKFTAKELDNETSYTYFGARYYDSELSVWLSVDPMSDKRRWVSPYAYCQWNPLVLVDPSGMLDWEPVVTESGGVKYLAEKGDNIYTFMSQYNLSFDQAKSIFENAGISNPVNNFGFAKSIKIGTAIGGDAVKKVIGSEILKLDWESKRATGQRKTDQIMFALKYNKTKENWCFDMKDFNTNMYNAYEGLTLHNKVNIRVGDNERIPAVTLDASFDGRSMIMTDYKSGDVDGTNDDLYRYFDPAGKYGVPRLYIRINEKYSEKYENYY